MHLLTDEYFMKQALQEARQAAESGEIPVGAVIVAGGRIVARAHNLTQTLSDVTAHAEMQAITAAASTLNSKYLQDCTLYVTLEPCLMCAGATRWAQIGRIVYGAADTKNGFSATAQNALHPKTEVINGLLQNECALLLTDFFAKRRK